MSQRHDWSAMDETAEWGVRHLRDNVVHIRPVHELEPHVRPLSRRANRRAWARAAWSVAVFVALVAVLSLLR